MLGAQVLLLRAKTAGEEAYALDAGYTPAQKHLAAAGDRHGALLELEAAEMDHDRATPAVDVVEVAGGAWKVRRWSSGYRGAVLRRLGLHGDANTASSQVLQGPPQWQTSAMVDLARSHTALGDVAAAAAALEDAYLLNARAGLAQRQGRVRAARALLPDAPAVRQLDAVLRG
jgi:hypothetical protein